MSGILLRLICISLMTSDVPSLFTSLFIVDVPSLEKYLLESPAHFSVRRADPASSVGRGSNGEFTSEALPGALNHLQGL